MAKAKRANSTKRPTSSTDPIIDLIRQANEALSELRQATEEHAAILAKIGADNVKRKPIEGPLAFQHLFSRYSFDGLGPFDRACRRTERQLRDVVRGERQSLKSGRLDPAQQLIARQNILQAQVELAQMPFIRAWGEREWRREDARVTRLRRTSGFDKADVKRSEAYFAMKQAVARVSKAVPKTAQGCLDLVRFVADRNTQAGLLGIKDAAAEVCAPLYRAHDVLHSMRLAVAAEKKRRGLRPRIDRSQVSC